MIRVYYEFLRAAPGANPSTPDGTTGGSFDLPGCVSIEMREDKIYAAYDGFPFRALLAERGLSVSSGGAWSLITSVDGPRGPIGKLSFKIEERD